MKLKHFFLAAALTLLGVAALAQGAAVEVQNAWVRATVKGQMGTGAFMTLRSDHGARLVGVSSPVAGVVQVHEMKLDGGVMKMAAVKGGLELPAGKAVELKPGGYHVMLMDLKAPLEKGSKVALTLILKDAQGREVKQALQVPVAATAPGGSGKPATMDHSMQHMHGTMPKTQ